MNQPLPEPSTANLDDDAPRVCDASAFGVLAIGGADATAFLQGQLSSDVKRLAAGRLQWTSYNSPKGRMLANGALWRPPAGEGYRLALAADIAEATVKRLTMFVLRSKVSIRDLSATHARIGVAGAGAAGAVARALGVVLDPGSVVAQGSAEIVALDVDRVLVVVPRQDAEDVRTRLDAAGRGGSAGDWRRGGILAGMALVTAATRETLLPQAANMDALGAVVLNRDKGCFPGQEIIKRTQALGQLKERLYAFAVAGAPPSPGARIFGATFGDQACGVVVDAADTPQGGALLLATVQTRAAEADELHVEAPDGRVLSRRALPYALPGDAAR